MLVVDRDPPSDLRVNPQKRSSRDPPSVSPRKAQTVQITLQLSRKARPGTSLCSAWIDEPPLFRSPNLCEFQSSSPPLLRNGGHLIFPRYTANIDFSLGRQPSSYGAAPPTAVLLKQTLPRPALRANLSPLRTRLRALSVRLLSRRVPAADPLHHYPTAPYRRTRPQPETLTQDLRFVSILALAPPSSPLQYTLHYNL